MANVKAEIVFWVCVAAFTVMQFIPYVESVPVPYPTDYPVANASWAAATSLYKKRSFESAASQFISLAEAGNREAQFVAGLMYWRGQGVNRDYCQGTYWFDTSARNGNALAKIYLALAYYLSKGVRSDDDLAAQLYITAQKELRKQSGRYDLRFFQNQMGVRATFWFLDDLVSEQDSVAEPKHLQPAKIRRFKNSAFFSMSIFVPAVDACDGEALEL